MIHKFAPFEFFKLHKIEIESVLDIGARKGLWTKRFKEHFPNVRSLMIEASADHIDDLIRAGHYITALVGKNNEEVDYYECEDKDNNHGNGIYKENSNVPFKVTRRKCTTLDSLLPGQRFDLIKMDVQGSELDIIKGAVPIIKKTTHLILETQTLNYNDKAPRLTEIVCYLNTLNFSLIDVIDVHYTLNNTLFQVDVLFERRIND